LPKKRFFDPISKLSTVSLLKLPCTPWGLPIEMNDPNRPALVLTPPGL
jgi:hypothetical protein